MPEVVFISVVRDFAVQENCMAKLSGDVRVDIRAVDNRGLNDPIPVLYNRFLDAYDYSRPAWLVFCHEDFECDGSIVDALHDVPTDAIYGPIGARFRVEHVLDVHVDVCGQIKQSNRDGSGLHLLGKKMPSGSIVDTLDCCCLIVHSSLVDSFRLRFDVQFQFDMYAEDFCVSAKENHAILSRTLDFTCRHWSGGVLGERYRVQLHNFNKKWPAETYASTCTFAIGGRRSFRWLVGRIKNCGVKTWFRNRLRSLLAQ